MFQLEIWITLYKMITFTLFKTENPLYVIIVTLFCTFIVLVFSLTKCRKIVSLYVWIWILQDDHLIQTVTVRMSLRTRRKILQLDHENILKVNKIKTDCYKTILVSKFTSFIP